MCGGGGGGGAAHHQSGDLILDISYVYSLLFVIALYENVNTHTWTAEISLLDSNII